MTYKVVISKSNKSFPKKFGLNELLEAERNTKHYDYRMKKSIYKPNKVKKDGEMICQKCIKSQLKGVQISKPIICTYYIYVPDKTHDRSNTYAGIEKIFLDSLQNEKIIKNDGYNYVYDSIFHTSVDSLNPRVEVIIEEVEVQDE